MTKIPRKEHFARSGKAPHAAAYQARFLVFLLAVLIAYTFLLLVFRKLALIVQLPVFIPIALGVLIVFIGVAGTLYSHKFAGPVVRIRRVLDHMADGDYAVTLRLREADDPMMKDLAQSIGRLCERSRNSCEAVRLSAQDLVQELAEIETGIRSKTPAADLEKRLTSLQEKRIALERSVKNLGA